MEFYKKIYSFKILIIDQYLPISQAACPLVFFALRYPFIVNRLNVLTLHVLSKVRMKHVLQLRYQDHSLNRKHYIR